MTCQTCSEGFKQSIISSSQQPYNKTGLSEFSWGFPGGSVVKNLLANSGDIGDRFNPWVRKIPWRREWQPTPVFLPGESHGQRSLVGYSPRGHRESDMTQHAVCTLVAWFVEVVDEQKQINFTRVWVELRLFSPTANALKPSTQRRVPWAAASVSSGGLQTNPKPHPRQTESETSF